MILIDSNGQSLRSDEIHQQKEVCIETRYTLTQAMEHIPEIDSPESVTDIVVLIGVNDSTNPSESTSDTEKKHLKLMKTYNQKYPNAHFHISAVPPMGPKQERLNERLENLASRTGESFISTRNMYDRYDTKRVRPGMLKKWDEKHYTETGIKIIAKEVKRSLHMRNKETTFHEQPRNKLSMTNTVETSNASRVTTNPKPSSNNIFYEIKQLLAQIPLSPMKT